MENLNRDQQIIQSVLENIAAQDPDAQLVLDTKRDRYLIVHNSWHNDSRIYGCSIHLDLIDGKIWIQHNSTEIQIDQELISAGIPPKNIILGFRSPTIRSLLEKVSA
jgi:hypothetical protein